MNFIVIPVVKALATQLTIPDKNRDVKVAVRKVGNHANSCCVVGCIGVTGMIMADCTTIVARPVRIPAAQKGIKYCTKFRLYKLKV